MSQASLPNVLLERLPSYETLKDVIAAITYQPLNNLIEKDLTFVEKDNILTGEKVMLIPNKKIIMSVMTWFGMLKTGLQNRNPALAQNKRHYFEYQELGKKISEYPKTPSSGISVNVLKGPTGTGKTVTIQRFCASLPQVIEHGKNEAAGWVYHKQLVYLHVNLSHDGSRGGFMYSILLAMDNALGTQYAISILKQNRTVEKLAVATVARLIAHHTGIIFIDESQLRNLVKNNQAELMQLFLLQLMNSGIPIVLSGNERAFDWLNYSQDLSRLALTETSHFFPVGALDEVGWDTEWEVLSKGIMQFYVLTEAPRSPLECSMMLLRCSGGIARLAIILWSEAQRVCLYHQRSYVAPEDIEDVYHGFSYSKIKPLADGFRYKNANLLSNFPDIDESFYRGNWQNVNIAESSSEGNESSPVNNISQSKSIKKRSEQSKFKSQQTNEKNKRNKSSLLRENLSSEDMRINGLINHNLDQLAALRQEIES